MFIDDGERDGAEAAAYLSLTVMRLLMMEKRLLMMERDGAEAAAHLSLMVMRLLMMEKQYPLSALVTPYTMMRPCVHV